jgi:type II secretory ATPase GspE/PulE/Tfp pilus assembly ATPase PilB-like protein
VLGLETEKASQFFHGKGCDRCFHTGYSGRIGVFEVMQVNERVRELIANNHPEAAVKKEVLDQGMNTLRESGVKKVLRGETTVEEILRVIL